MFKIYIFIPNDIKHNTILNGFIRKTPDEICFYIINNYKTNSKSIIGYCGNEGYHKNSQKLNFLHVNINHKNEVKIIDIRIEHLIKPLENTNIQIFCARYDKFVFENTELFIQKSSNFDRFQILAKSVKNSHKIKQKQSKFTIFLHKILFLFINLLYLLLNKLKNGLDVLEPMLKYSCVGIHLLEWINQLHLIVKTKKNTGKLNLHTENLLVTITVDILFGFILMYCASQSKDSATSVGVKLIDGAVSNLRELNQFLMGSPVGLKLNHSFNELLGRFFLYHITLWWTFLMVGIPLLPVLSTLRWLGPLGFTFVSAVLADLIALGTFHVYCIYVYASRFYRFQIMGLSALWRLFLGRKFNPLRNRVDSCQYSHRQLFVGTLSFTILLFLLPTTTVYYAVFATLRLCLIAVDNILLKSRKILQNFPLFITCLWLIKSPAIAANIHIKMEMPTRTNEKVVSFFVTLEPQTWKQTVKSCSISQYLKEKQTENIFQKIVFGHLL